MKTHGPAQLDQAALPATFLQDIIDENSIEICVVCPSTLKFIYCNKTAQRNLGYTAAEFRKLGPADINEDLARPKLVRLLQPLLQGEKEEIVFETRRRPKRGKTYPIELRIWFSRNTLPAVLVTNSVNISARKKAEDKLHKAQSELERRVKERTSELNKSREELGNLALRLQSMQEEERARISREIHDELGQSLTALKFEVAFLKRRLREHSSEISDGFVPCLLKLDAMSTFIDETIDSLRRISADLRPAILDGFGATDAIEWLAGEFQKRTGIRTRLKCEPAEIELDPALSTAVFRITQEALTNVARHATSSSVNVVIRATNRQVRLEVADKGRGITKREATDPKSLGLIGIRERLRPWNGELLIEGRAGKGTRIVATIPLTQTQEKRHVEHPHRR